MPDKTSDSSQAKKDKVALSQFTDALVSSLKGMKPKRRPDEISRIIVSQTVSFFGIMYEKVRNAVEYREDHLVRRAAIERILKRRLGLNPNGKNEAENLIRELLWARYFNNGSLGGEDVVNIQQIIDRYVKIRRMVLVGRPYDQRQYLEEFLFQLMTCEIEESLDPESSQRSSSFTFYIYQILRRKIRIEGLSDEEKDAYFLAAIERAYRKSDKSYQRYHFFITFYKPLHEYNESEIDELSAKIPSILKKIDEMITSSYVDKLMRFARKQMPPFLILFEIIKTKFKEIPDLLTDRNALWKEVDLMCRSKYQYVSSRIRVLAFRSFIYILLTKMVFALILEFPVSNYLYGEVNMTSIIINSVFPPLLMLLIVSVFRLPDERNTQRIFRRIIDIIDKDRTFETQVAFMPKKSKTRRPVLIFGFTVFYTLTFVVTLFIIYSILTMLKFNIVSQLIFIFFVSVVSFFSYRVKQVVNEYRLEEKQGILSPLVDFFFMPVLSLGKFFSSEISKLNFFIFIFDFLIEAPFKFIFEIIEEWISFVRKRKEEII